MGAAETARDSQVRLRETDTRREADNDFCNVASVSYRSVHVDVRNIFPLGGSVSLDSRINRRGLEFIDCRRNILCDAPVSSCIPQATDHQPHL